MSLEEQELAILAGYCSVRFGTTKLKKDGKEYLQVAIWDTNQERLTWAVDILNRLIPMSGKNKPLKITEQKKRKTMFIFIVGKRAVKFCDLIYPYLIGTPMAKVLEKAS